MTLRVPVRITTERLGLRPWQPADAIRCDPENVASAAIPRRLGYRLRELLRGNVQKPDGTPRDTLVWEITRAELARGRAAGAAGPARSS